jgi:hypothetical protein
MMELQSRAVHSDRVFHRSVASRNRPLKSITTKMFILAYQTWSSSVSIDCSSLSIHSRKTLVKVHFSRDLKMPSTINNNYSPVSNDSPLSRSVTSPNS